MANLYDTSTNNYCSPQEPDDISLFLHQILLHSSSSSSHSCLQQPPQTVGQISAAEPSSAFNSSSTCNFANVSPTSAGNLDNEADDYDYESEEAIEAMGAETAQKSAPLRCSSKRSRAAEVHNLSEKRRRSRINEKMKALQNLIPNSNKTDKASMLDEAIEYLKQLQLQVQMLTMRNGLSLYPSSLPDMLQQPSQVSQTRMDVYETDKYIDVNMTKEMSMNENILSRAKHEHVSDFSHMIGSKASPDSESSLLQDHFGAFQLSRSSSKKKEMFPCQPLLQDCPQSGSAGAKSTSSVPSETQTSSLKENILEACVAGADTLLENYAKKHK